MCEMKDDNDEMPADFDNEIHKWSLECKYIHIWPSELSVDNWIALRYSTTQISGNSE
jgi:hypothetical protein